MELKKVLEILHQHASELRRHHVKSISVFGSVARGEARPDSDVDILVEFDRRVGLFAFVGLKLHLESILGRPVDLVTPGGLRPSMRAAILSEAVHAA